MIIDVRSNFVQSALHATQQQKCQFLILINAIQLSSCTVMQVLPFCLARSLM